MDVCRNGVARAVGTSPCDQAVFDLAPRPVDCYVRGGVSRRTEQVLYLYGCPVRPGGVCGRNHLGVERGRVMDDSQHEAATIYDDGVAMFDEGRWGEAVTAFAQVIEIEPSDTELLALAYVIRSTALSRLERVEEAVADATAAIDLQPDDIDILGQAYLNRSIAVSRLERVEEAVADATAAIDLQPSSDILAAAYVSRSVDLILLDRVEEAVADVTAAIDLQPDDIDILAQAYVNRSIALSTMERTDEAVADLRMVLDLVPPTHELNRQALALLA